MTKKHLLTLVLALALLCAAMGPAAQAEGYPNTRTIICMPSSQFGGWYVCKPVNPAPTPAPTATPTAAPTPKPTAAPTKAPVQTAQPSNAVNQSGMAAQVVAETNAERAKYGLKALTVDADLTAAAQIRAREIAQVFSHTRPDGTSCFTVSNKAFGENIARGYTYTAKVMAAWMSSEGHRANILRASYGSIGVACVQVNGIYCWVQLFGR